jgi:hypothetical protein
MKTLILLLLAADGGATLQWSPVQLTASPQAMMPDGGVKLSDEVTFRGAIELTSSAETFGGLSGLRLWKGSLYAVSDKRGTLFRFKPKLDAKGTLVGVENGAEAASIDVGDAEALELTEDELWVSNEDSLSLSRFRLQGDRIGATATRSALPTEGWGLGRNKGFEAMAAKKDCALIFAEAAGNGFVGKPQALATAAPNLTALSWPEGFSPTDVAWAEPGKLAYVVLRKFDGNAYGGLARVTLKDCSPKDFKIEVLAQWGWPLLTDNSEAIDVAVSKEGTALFVLSDDNFKSKGPQRTLLYKFSLR